MKIFIYVTNPIDALKGDFDWCLNASTRSDLGENLEHYTLAGEVDVELNIDAASMTKTASDALDAEMEKVTEKFNAEIAVLKEERSKLLSLEYKGDV